MWALLFILVVVVAVVVANVGDRARSTTSFVEGMRDQTLKLGQDAQAFHDLVQRLNTVGRLELQTVVDGVDKSLGEVSAALADPPPDPHLEAGTVLLGVAIDQWKQGIDGYRTALLDAADRPDDLGASDALQSALLGIRTGDRLYEAFRQEMQTSPSTQPVSGFPDLAFYPVQYPMTAITQALLTVARAENSPLKLRAELAISQVTTQPQWMQSADGKTVVVATDSLTVEVVVVNKGNAPTEPQQLLVNLTSGTKTVDSRTGDVASLDAQAKTVVDFSGLAVQPGAAYTLTVSLGSTSVAATSDTNTRTIDFQVNTETTSTTTGG